MEVLLKRNHVYLGVVIASLGITKSYANFTEDDKFSVTLRNFYFDRQYSDPLAKDTGSWSQGVVAQYESGYTDTPVQVGLDASLKYAVRLNDQNQERADGNFPFDPVKNRQYRDYSKYGLTLKFKYHDTELKVGELNLKTPVAYIDDARQLPTSYAGVMLESKELKNLKISAGRVTRINARNDDNYQKLSLSTTGPRYESDGLNFIGFDYTSTPNFKTSYWFGQVEDIYQQNYFGMNYVKDFGTYKLKLDSSYFYNKEDGAALYGDIDSQSLGVMGTFINDQHNLNIGVQKNFGESIFPTLAGYPPQPYLQAWSNLPFVNPEEFVWYINYYYDFKSLGASGLKARLGYHHGDGIFRKGYLDNKETEKIAGLIYVVPEGKFKGLGLEWRYTETEVKYGVANLPGNDFKENRIITTYTFKF